MLVDYSGERLIKIAGNILKPRPGFVVWASEACDYFVSKSLYHGNAFFMKAEKLRSFL